MKTVIMSGSRRMNRLDAEVRSRIDQLIDKEFYILIADANAGGKVVQKYFSERQYPNVVVFCSSGQCQNDFTGWPVNSIPAPHHIRDLRFFTAKDAAIICEDDVGLMLWDGQSTGTIVNVN